MKTVDEVYDFCDNILAEHHEELHTLAKAVVDDIYNGLEDDELFERHPEGWSDRTKMHRLLKAAVEGWVHEELSLFFASEGLRSGVNRRKQIREAKNG